MARRRSADVTPVLRPSGLAEACDAGGGEADRPGHKKRPRVRGLGLRRRPRQRRVHSSGTAPACQENQTDMRAILSVSDKNGLVELARGLTELGVELISTGGTAKAIAAAGLPVVNVSDVTGFPEMMDGRVKTLHPAMFAGILARRGRPDDLSALAAQGIATIDVVVVNLYPFGKAADNPDTKFDALVEEIDIGGPSLLRAAAKNFRDVLVVTHPQDYTAVLEELARAGGPSLEFRFGLMKKAFMHTAQYDGMIAMTMNHVKVGERTVERLPPAPRPVAAASAPRDLRYGENPHQRAAWISPPQG